MQLSMHFLTTALLAALALSAPNSTPQLLMERGARLNGAYSCYKGNGSPSEGWPSISQWPSFNDLWNAQQSLLRNSCQWSGWGPNNSPREIHAIRSAILSVSHSTGVDARFILAIVMQESKGCVRVPTTHNGADNPGLMQSHNGAGTCHHQSPCPASVITQMIHDGTAGTGSGPGLQQLLQRAHAHAAGGKLAQKTYIAARLYNSGSADFADLNHGMGSTASYANDVANRLHGWVSISPRSCTPS